MGGLLRAGAKSWPGLPSWRAEPLAPPYAQMTVAVRLFTVVGTAIGLIRALPQLVRLLRTRNSHGVSLDAAATSSLVSAAWAGYGWLTGQPAVVMASGASAVMFALVAGAALRWGRRAAEMRATRVWLVVLALAWGLGGAEGLGLVLPVGVLVANGPQLLVAWREPDLSGLSLGTWYLSVAEALAWGAYGRLAGDAAILVYGVLHLTTSAGIVLLGVGKRGPGRPSTEGGS